MFHKNHRLLIPLASVDTDEDAQRWRLAAPIPMTLLIPAPRIHLLALMKTPLYLVCPHLHVALAQCRYRVPLAYHQAWHKPSSPLFGWISTRKEGTTRTHPMIDPQSALFRTVAFPMHPALLDIEHAIGAPVGDTTFGR